MSERSKLMLGADDPRVDLAQIFERALHSLSEVRSKELLSGSQGVPPLFFPGGIEHIKLSVTAGLKESPQFSAELQIDGANSPKPASQPDHVRFASLLGAVATESITQICKEEWPDHKQLCNDFVIAVAHRVGVTLSGVADEILKQIARAPWSSLGNNGVAASDAAKAGRLVVAGLSSSELSDDDGHVVIVVPPTDPLAHEKYPYAYWGSKNMNIR